MNFNTVSPGTSPQNDVNVVVDAPLGGQLKRYPGNYGLAPHTLPDADTSIDLLIANTGASESPPDCKRDCLMQVGEVHKPSGWAGIMRDAND